MPYALPRAPGEDHGQPGIDRGPKVRREIGGVVPRSSPWSAPSSRLAIIMFTPTLSLSIEKGRATARRNSLFGTPRQ
jgi:hypothetical protein